MIYKSPNFLRKIENFICENCNTNNIGNGYTNHCFNCLYSKHVDINPGDRKNSCNGIMRPVDYITKGDNYIIIHQCETCFIRKSNKLSDLDNLDMLIKITKLKFY